MQIQPLLSKIEPNFLNQYLRACGIEDVKQYLKADKSNYDNPFDYPNMEMAIDMTQKAIQDNLKIGIIIDSDADGYCSAAITYQFLRIVNPNLEIEMFTHTSKQHGLKDLISEIIKSNVRFLIVPDAGTNDTDECQILSSAGILILILDHHEVTKSNPFATIINHHIGTDLNTALSGTGVVDKWVRAYCTKFGIEYPGFEDLVAVSIATDVCSLVSTENRTYIQQGLANLDNANPFIGYLFEKNCYRGVTPEGISFGIAPLVNSLARSTITDRKMVFFDGLVGNDIEPEGALKELKAIKKLQDDRVKTVLEEIKSNIDCEHKVVVAIIDNADAPYTGLIAGKLCGEYHKPVLVLRQRYSTSYSGSMRSPIDLADRINETGLASCSGHKASCGIVIEKCNYDKLIEWFDGLDLDIHPAEPVTGRLLPNQVNLNLCAVCQDNKILWGKDVPEPLWYFKFNLRKEDIQILGKNLNTIKFIADGVEFIKFKAADELITSVTSVPSFQLEVICKLSVNEWQGVKTPQAIIEKYEFTSLQKENLDFEDIF